MIGYHLEQAHRYRSELAPLGEAEGDLALRAGLRLHAAGVRAFERRDVPAAADLLGRAAALLPADHPERRTTLLALGEVLAEGGELGPAQAALDEAVMLGTQADDAATAANAGILRLFLLESTDPKLLDRDAVAEAERLIAVLEGLGDELGLARAWRLMGDLYWTQARYGAADAALARAIEHARRAGAAREESDALGRYTGSGTYGPAPADEIQRRCDELMGSTAGTGYEAPALRALAWVRAMQGRFEDARDLVRRARAIFEELGLRLRSLFVSETAGAIEMLAGDPVAAEREWRAGFEAAVEMGEQGFQSTVAALIAHALVEQGRPAEAEEMVSVSEVAGAEDDVSTQVMWRSARARILAMGGRAAEAEALAREAVARSAATDDLNMRADTLVDLAEVLRIAGDAGGAEGAEREALQLYGTKGNAVAAASVRRRLGASRI